MANGNGATLFLRIHKTASEALAKQLLDRLPPGTVCPDAFEWRVRARTPEALRRFAFFQGHIAPEALRGAFDTLRVFTMLREPRERLLSCYFYWKEGARHAGGAFLDALRPLSLPQFLRSEDPIIRRATWNAQARLLAGGRFGPDDGHRQNVFGPDLGVAGLIAGMEAALDRHALVGVADRYEESLRAAYALLGLGAPPPPERINVTASRPSDYGPLLGTPEIAKALAALTEADRVAYDAARRRLDLAPAARYGSP